MRVLLCVAGMPYAEAAVQITALIADITGAEVTLLHVARQVEEQPVAEGVLAAASKMLPEIPKETRVRHGDPVKEILAEEREGQYDLLILGARQHASASQRLLGSVTQQVIRRISISTLVARQVQPSLERILIGTSGAPVAEPVIEWGCELAQRAHAQPTILHVVSPVPSMYTGLGAIEETLPDLLQTDTPVAQHLRYCAERLAQHQLAGNLKLRYGIAADEILREMVENDYDLVIVGSSGTAGRLRTLLMGNVTRQIVENAPCSVLVVRPSFFSWQDAQPRPGNKLP